MKNTNEAIAAAHVAKIEVLEAETALDTNILMLGSVKSRLARLEQDRGQDPLDPAGELKKARIKEAALLRDIEAARLALIGKRAKLYRLELEFQQSLWFEE